MATFGERLRFLREEKGLSQYEVARLRKMPRSTYANYETGIREPDIETQKWFASFYGVTLDYLSGLTDIRVPAPTETRPARLRRLREAAGHSCQTLGQRTHVAPDMIEQAEAGEIELPGSAAVRIADELGVGLAYLRCATDDPQIKDHLPPEWEQMVEKIRSGGFSLEDLATALKLLEIAQKREQNIP